MNVRELENAMRERSVDPDVVAQHIRDAVSVISTLRAEAKAALRRREPELRPVLRRFLRGYTDVWGTSTVEQIQQFVECEDSLFSDLAILAWGFDPCA